MWSSSVDQPPLHDSWDNATIWYLAPGGMCQQWHTRVSHALQLALWRSSCPFGLGVGPASCGWGHSAASFPFFQLLLEIWRLKQQETYPWQKPHESLQWQAPLSEPITKAGVWLWGTDVSFSDVTDSKCCKWLFAEAELKNNNHFQVFLPPLPFPLVLRCYFASIWERHKAFRLDDFGTTLSLGLPPDLNNAESCEILDIKGDNSKAERGKKPSLKRPVRDLVLWKSSAGREL